MMEDLMSMMGSAPSDAAKKALVKKAIVRRAVKKALVKKAIKKKAVKKALVRKAVKRKATRAAPPKQQGVVASTVDTVAETMELRRKLEGPNTFED